MEKFFSDAAAAADVPRLWQVLLDHLAFFDVTRVTAVHLPPVGAPDANRSRVRSIGYPEDWIFKYVGHLHEDDPMPSQANAQAKPFRWSEIASLRELTDAQTSFLIAFDAVNEGRDGLAVPVFGPNGRNGYLGLAFPERGQEPSPEVLHILQVSVQYAHQCFCGLIVLDLPDHPALSPREIEVLNWMAQGKSNSVIADIVGVRANTVDTHIRRIFAKLGVTDRVSAVLAGLGEGIIKLR